MCVALSGLLCQIEDVTDCKHKCTYESHTVLRSERLLCRMNVRSLSFCVSYIKLCLSLITISTELALDSWCVTCAHTCTSLAACLSNTLSRGGYGQIQCGDSCTSSVISDVLHV